MSATEYCWSRNGEDFHGHFPTREDAKAEGEADASEELAPGESATIYTGEIRSAMHFMRKWESSTGVHVVESLEEWLGDSIASDDQIIEMPDEKAVELGKVILDFIESHATFRRWGVEEIQQHEFIAPLEAAGR